MADEDDYCALGKVGEYLQDHYNLKSIAELHAEDLRTVDALRQQVKEEIYSLKRQLDQAERSGKWLAVEYEEKLYDREMAHRTDVEKAKRVIAQHFGSQLEVLQSRLCIEERCMEELKVEKAAGGGPSIGDLECEDETPTQEA